MLSSASTGLPFPDIDPILLQIDISGISFALRWYALAYIGGIVVGWAIATAALRRARLWAGDAAPMTTEAFGDFVFWLIIGVIVGGRIGYVAFYDPGMISANPLNFFALWQGGMSFHGGFAGVCVAAFLYARKIDAPLRQVCDLLALATPPGLLLGRIANFINAELWGRPTSQPWGVIFPGADTCASAPAGLCARHPSQLYEAGLEGLLLGAILIVMAFGLRALTRPGLLCGVFFAGYAASRIFVEQFRQADAQFISESNPMGHVIRLGELGLSMGQVLSLPMLVAGLLLILTSRPRSTALA